MFIDPNQSVANNMNLFENICYAPIKKKERMVKPSQNTSLKETLFLAIDLFSNLDIILCNLLKLCSAEKILRIPP